MDEHHAIFLAANKGLDSPVFFRTGSQAQQIRFKALNAKTCEDSKDVAMASRDRAPGIFPQRLNRDLARTDFLRSVVPGFQVPPRTGSPPPLAVKRPPGKSGETPETKGARKDGDEL